MEYDSMGGGGGFNGGVLGRAANTTGTDEQQRLNGNGTAFGSSRGNNAGPTNNNQGGFTAF